MADVKIHWKVDPSPVGKYRSFEKRAWPTAYYGKNGKPAAFIRCADAYCPAEAREGTHGELTIDIAHHQHPKAGNSWTLMRLARRAKTLTEARTIVAEFIARHPEVHPLPAKVVEPEVPLETELADAMLRLLEILAFRKAGGSQLVLNMEEPKIIAKAEAALNRAGIDSTSIALHLRNAEAKAHDKK